jgi:hypothetical protein
MASTAGIHFHNHHAPWFNQACVMQDLMQPQPFLLLVSNLVKPGLELIKNVTFLYNLQISGVTLPLEALLQGYA